MLTTQEEKVRQLTAMDRCDSCNAQAFVWVNGVSGDLLFCGHHFTKWESKIYSNFGKIFIYILLISLLFLIGMVSCLNHYD